MERIKNFFRQKGFYVALFTGMFAFMGLMVAYRYNSYKEEFQSKQEIDLNAPQRTEMTDDESVAQAVAGQTDAKETTQNVQEETAVAKIPEQQETTEEMKQQESTEEKEETAQASSNGVIVNQEGEIVANWFDGTSTLVWPVEGEVILPFNMESTVYFKTLDSYRCNPGILLAAKEGTNVLAAYEGVVDSVYDDPQHGTTVVVEMGNGFQAIYGQLMNVCVAEEDAISTAQPIGEVGPVTSYYKEEGTHAYFELQKDGKPVNPLQYMQ
ncbi:MAG: peptidoglycan DD-metalloendopeptidase family protein [Wujia sp.]